MSREDRAHADGFEAGYLAALKDLRALVEERVTGMRGHEDGLGAFSPIFNGIRNGLDELVATHELRGVKLLAARRRS